jgi:putative FmdB family regulatory protein
VPIYEYQCRQCGAVTEVLVRVQAAEGSVPCRACGGTETEKIFSAAAVLTHSAPPCAEKCGRTDAAGRDLPCGSPCCPH